MHKSAEWYERVLNSLRDLVLVKGLKSNILWANKAFLTYYGMTPEQLQEKIDGPQSDPDDTLLYIRDDQSVVESGQDLLIESEDVTDLSGKTRSFCTIKSPIFENGRVISTVGISRLIDDEIVPKRSLSHHDSKVFASPLRMLTQGFPIPMCLLDLKMRPLNCSDTWISTFGPLPTQDTENFSDVYPKLSVLRESIRKAMEAEETQKKEISVFSGFAESAFIMQVRSWKFPDGSLGGGYHRRL